MRSDEFEKLLMYKINEWICHISVCSFSFDIFSEKLPIVYSVLQQMKSWTLSFDLIQCSLFHSNYFRQMLDREREELKGI